MKIYSYVSLLNEGGNPYITPNRHYEIDGRRNYSTPDDVAEFVYKGLELQNFAEEYVYVLCLDGRNHLIGCFELTHGCVNGSLISQREVYQKALMIGAVKIIMTHNHPGNDPTPSSPDVEATRVVLEAGKIVGIQLIDHIVVSKCGYVSMRESGYFNN